MYDNHFLSHYGVSGMKWGVRKSTNTNRLNKKVRKQATKDANRYMDAKMAYGKGAGTRRKLLKAELTPKLKDPFYATSFDDALAQINVAKSADKARTWRKKEDVKDQAVRSTKQIANYVTGTTSVAAIGLAYLKYKPQVDSFVSNTASKIKNQMGQK